jgi:glycosyltransferase involved in cell wall biosynthesis
VLLWTYSPLASEVFDLDDFDSVVFHCVDDLASNLGAPSKLIERLERDLATQADLVVASAPPLYERLSSYNPQTRHFHNVVDVGHFARPDGLLPEPPDLADVPPPRALFVGALSDHKIDWPLLAEVAKRRTEWAFVFVGPAGEESMQADIDAVTGLANVYLLGHRDYATLPSYMWAADAGLIPYRLSRHTESIFPMKTLEYAAAGIPIVSTPLPGVVAAQADGLKIEIAEDAEEFARGLGAPPESSNQSYVEKHTWDSLLTRIFAALPGREAPR